MKWKEFVLEYILWILSYVGLVFLFGFFFYSLHVEFSFLLLYFLLFLFFGFFFLVFFYFKKKKFYESFFSILNQLSEKYLISEMDLIPTFLEAKKLMEALYEIDKSMNESLGILKDANQSFREYVEM